MSGHLLFGRERDMPERIGKKGDARRREEGAVNGWASRNLSDDVRRGRRPRLKGGVET